MSRLLVFCGTRAAIERFDMLPDWTVIVGQYPQEQKAEMISAWRERGGNLAVDRSMLHGWRAPADTIVLFDPSWRYAHDSAESIQAVARVGMAEDIFATMTPWRDSDVALPLDPTRYRK